MRISGNLTISGGTVNITTTSDAAKALKAEGDFIATGGEITARVEGNGIWDSTKLKTKASACIGIDKNLDISGGSFNLSATGGGGKGINVDGDCHISGGNFVISTTGGIAAYVNGSINNNYTGNTDRLNSDYKSSPKGIKVDGDIVIDDCDIYIHTKGNGGEGMESKKTLTVNGGKKVINSYEDGTNSSTHTYINGGEIEITTGTGDAMDANGNIYIAGGKTTIIGASSPEQGLDAGDGSSVYITGGTLLEGGGGNSTPTSSLSTQPYVILQQTLTPGQTVTLKEGDTELATFVIPAKYSTTMPQLAAPGGGGGGTGGSSVLISAPGMVSGRSYTVLFGTTSVTATARTTGGSTGPGH